ncbi:MAG: hypothetical protein DRN27_05350 [Thermoplasmata archaeon]|nr:MAG: hypothetical protein DRN27_05350 [Thermoplasmata archaeon]
MSNNPEGLLKRYVPETIDDFWDMLLPNRCDGCSLSKSRSQIVKNRGNGDNGIFIVGQNPGKNEDEQGIPFIGNAGKLLDEMLIESNINPNQCWFSNACKCHSKDNQTPNKNQINTCKPLLIEETEILDPLIIVTVGKPAYSAVSGDFDDRVSMKHIAGNVMESKELFRNFVPIYHPAYLLRLKEQSQYDYIYEQTIESLFLIKMIAEIEKESRA